MLHSLITVENRALFDLSAGVLVKSTKEGDYFSFPGDSVALRLLSKEPWSLGNGIDEMRKSTRSCEELDSSSPDRGSSTSSCGDAVHAFYESSAICSAETPSVSSDQPQHNSNSNKRSQLSPEIASNAESTVQPSSKASHSSAANAQTSSPHSAENTEEKQRALLKTINQELKQHAGTRFTHHVTAMTKMRENLMKKLGIDNVKSRYQEKKCKCTAEELHHANVESGSGVDNLSAHDKRVVCALCGGMRHANRATISTNEANAFSSQGEMTLVQQQCVRRHPKRPFSASSSRPRTSNMCQRPMTAARDRRPTGTQPMPSTPTETGIRIRRGMKRPYYEGTYSSSMYEAAAGTYCCIDDRMGHQTSDVRTVLQQRGYLPSYSASDGRSLLWALNDRKIPWRALHPLQIVNHFQGTRHLTSKSGLCQTIKSLPSLLSVDAHEFFPSCYNLSDSADRHDFVEHFRLSAAVSIVQYLVGLSSSHLAETSLCLEPLWLALRACYNASYRRSGELIDTDTRLSDDLCRPYQSHIRANVLNPFACRWRLHHMRAIQLTEGEWERVLDCSYQLGHDTHESSCVTFANVCDAVQQALLKECKYALRRLEQLVPQFQLFGGQNVWIIKPGGASRGVGVVLRNRLQDILPLMNHDRVVQKYIESPFLLPATPHDSSPPRFKFDIRVFALVTSYRPLTAYVYDVCYMRVASQPYTTDNSKLSDAMTHLCNYSVQRRSGHAAHVNAEVWTSHDLQQHLHTMPTDQLDHSGSHASGSTDVWADCVWPAILKVIAHTLAAGTTQAVHRENSFELYGMDIMLDSQLKPWLLEVNLSPALNKRTPFLTTFHRRMMEGLFEVVLGSQTSKSQSPHLVSGTPNDTATKDGCTESAHVASNSSRAAAIATEDSHSSESKPVCSSVCLMQPSIGSPQESTALQSEDTSCDEYSDDFESYSDNFDSDSEEPHFSAEIHQDADTQQLGVDSHTLLPEPHNTAAIQAHEIVCDSEAFEQQSDALDLESRGAASDLYYGQWRLLCGSDKDEPAAVPLWVAESGVAHDLTERDNFSFSDTNTVGSLTVIGCALTKRQMRLERSIDACNAVRDAAHTVVSAMQQAAAKRELTMLRQNRAAEVLVPAFRVWLRRLRLWHARRHCKCIRIQCAARMWLARNQLRALRAEFAAVQVQRLFRGHIGRLRALFARKTNAATAIQSKWRAHTAYQQLRCLRATRSIRFWCGFHWKRWTQKRYASAVRVQTAVCRFAHIQRKQRRVCAIKIQTIARVCLARRMLLCVRACVHLQRWYRQMAYHRFCVRLCSAITLQAAFRRHLQRGFLQQLKQQRLHNAACVITRAVRRACVVFNRIRRQEALQVVVRALQAWRLRVRLRQLSCQWHMQLQDMDAPLCAPVKPRKHSAMEALRIVRAMSAAASVIQAAWRSSRHYRTRVANVCDASPSWKAVGCTEVPQLQLSLSTIASVASNSSCGVCGCQVLSCTCVRRSVSARSARLAPLVRQTTKAVKSHSARAAAAHPTNQMQSEHAEAALRAQQRQERSYQAHKKRMEKAAKRAKKAADKARALDLRVSQEMPREPLQRRNSDAKRATGTTVSPVPPVRERLLQARRRSLKLQRLDSLSQHSGSCSTVDSEHPSARSRSSAISAQRGARPSGTAISDDPGSVLTGIHNCGGVHVLQAFAARRPVVPPSPVHLQSRGNGRPQRREAFTITASTKRGSQSNQSSQHQPEDCTPILPGWTSSEDMQQWLRECEQKIDRLRSKKRQ